MVSLINNSTIARFALYKRITTILIIAMRVTHFQRHRERGFEGFGRTPLSNQLDLIIASYIGSFKTKPS